MVPRAKPIVPELPDDGGSGAVCGSFFDLGGVLTSALTRARSCIRGGLAVVLAAVLATLPLAFAVAFGVALAFAMAMNSRCRPGSPKAGALRNS